MQADCDANGTKLGAPSQRLDLSLHTRRCPPWASQWSRAPIVEADLAFVDVATPPLVRRRTGHAHLSSNVRCWAPLGNPSDQNQPANRGEYRLRMGHRRASVWVDFNNPNSARGSLFVNNLYGHYI